MKTARKIISELKVPDTITFAVTNRWSDEINFDLVHTKTNKREFDSIEDLVNNNITIKFNQENEKLEFNVDNIESNIQSQVIGFAKKIIVVFDKYATPKASNIWKWYFSISNYSKISDDFYESLIKIYDLYQTQKISTTDTLKLIHFLYKKYS